MVAGPKPTMARWRKRLFVAASHVASDATGHLALPRDRTVTIGSQIEV
ncbi:hypothetical protein ABTW72_03115 [Micromonospora sp. NPDC127501]